MQQHGDFSIKVGQGQELYTRRREDPFYTERRVVRFWSGEWLVLERRVARYKPDRDTV